MTSEMVQDTMPVIDELFEEIRRTVQGTLRRNEPMKKHCSFGIGGPADLWAEPKSQPDLFVLLDSCKKWNIDCMIVGRGSNLLVRDAGIRGVVISLSRACTQLEARENAVAAGAGVSLIALVKFALHHGLQGLEFCIGIPGSVGGALATNAGAWGSSITDFIESVLVYDPGRKERRAIEKGSIDFGYRSSNVTSFGVLLEALFSLKAAQPAEIAERMDRYISQRAGTQPLRARCAGSIFKNPSGAYAGAVIERLGFKGYRRGGAQVSDLHANFIVNTGNAAAADVLAIIAEIKRRAKEEMMIDLEEEIQIVGEG